jgi:hypothetical protein
MNIPLATIRTQDDLIEALRVAKEKRNLSFKVLDELGGFTQGHMERVIGPRREKGMSPFVLQMLCSLLAVKLEMVFDEDQAKRMIAKWEGRDTSNVRLEKGNISKTLLERAKPHVLKANGVAGQAARHSMLTPEHRTQIARKAADALWKKRGRKRTRKATKKRAWYRKSMEERLAERKAGDLTA